ncbi:MAG: class I SAM-dependent methyltransferase [Chloroflexi bacterium]|nr:class I SAM-dependent methyltransferase [Chloroflexota bacterium]
MDAKLIDQMIELNRQFYTEFARSFSETRPAERANVTPLLPYLPDGTHVLDVGCGNGRIAQRLDLMHRRLQYIGVDVTPALVAAARARPYRTLRAEFRAADITEAGWEAVVRADAPFGAVLMTAVLHHMPGHALRLSVLRAARSLLAPGGVLVMSNWQFDRVERLRRKIAAWSVIGVDAAAMDEGDALIDWRRGGAVGYRYCHLLSQVEVRQLADESDFRVSDQFTADGGMNLFSVLKA